MVLAAFNVKVTEATLRAEVGKLLGGLDIELLDELIRHYGIGARIEVATASEIRAHLAQGRFAIAYLNRRIFLLPDYRSTIVAIRKPIIHAVVPVRVTREFVRYHDPLLSRPCSRTIARFTAAQALVGHACVICERS